MIQKFLKRIRFGLCESRGHTFYGPSLTPESVVVDLGACQGKFSEYITRAFGCPVYAVEASPALFSTIDVGKHPSIKRFNFAISDRDGFATFFESRNIVAGNIVGAKPNTVGSIQVEARTFEHFLESAGVRHIDLLKVDIEGAETLLFESSRDETIRNVKQITIEFHDSVRYPNGSSADVARIIARIRSLGFRGAAMGRSNLDWLFLHKEAVPLPPATQEYLDRLERRSP